MYHFLNSTVSKKKTSYMESGKYCFVLFLNHFKALVCSKFHHKKQTNKKKKKKKTARAS